MIDSAHRGWVALRQKETRQKRQTVSHLYSHPVCWCESLLIQLQRVQSVARKKGISLHLQPPGMARHAMNTSCTVWNRDRSAMYGMEQRPVSHDVLCRRQWSIEWRVQLVFPEAGQQYTEERSVYLCDTL